MFSADGKNIVSFPVTHCGMSSLTSLELRKTSPPPHTHTHRHTLCVCVSEYVWLLMCTHGECVYACAVIHACRGQRTTLSWTPFKIRSLIVLPWNFPSSLGFCPTSSKGTPVSASRAPGLQTHVTTPWTHACMLGIELWSLCLQGEFFHRSTLPLTTFLFSRYRFSCWESLRRFFFFSFYLDDLFLSWLFVYFYCELHL